MNSISQNPRASNHSLCLRTKLLANVQMQRWFCRSQVWHSHIGSNWNRIELKRVAHVSNVSCVWQTLEGQWLGLHGDGEAMGWCDLGLAQLASGITYDAQWPATTRHALMRVASQLWDAELLQAMGGQLQLHEHLTQSPTEMDGLFELTLVCKDTRQRHVHLLILHPLAVLRWLEDSRWQMEDTTDAQSINRWGDLKCQGQWLIGQKVLAIRLIRSLRPGDAVLIDGSRLGGPSAVRWLFGTHIIRWACSEDGTWTYEGLETMESHPTPLPLTDHTTTEGIPVAEKPMGGVNDIPVLLTFTVGQTSIAVRELLSLRAGQVIDLNCPSSTRVTISTHGQFIGHGELIDVEGRLAVEIVSLSALP